MTRDPGSNIACRGHGSLTDARSCVRSGLAAMSIVLCLPAVRTLTDGSWSITARAALCAVLVTVAAVHLSTTDRIVRSERLRRPAVVAALVAVTVAWTVISWNTPQHQPAWALVTGLAASSWLLTAGWARGAAMVEWSGRSTVAALGAMALVGAVVAIGPDGPALLPAPLRAALAVATVAVPTVVDVSQLWFWRIVQRQHAATELASELATTRERARIAAELHDIQGHSLHVIALEAELVDRLLASDPDAARSHARTVRALATDALRETRSLVHGYRRSDVAVEIANAAALLQAVGAEAVVRGPAAAIPRSAACAFGALVREATSNVLRHSTPRFVEITIEVDGQELRMSVCNDGVADGSGHPDGTGVAGLDARFRQLGGHVRADASRTGWWTVTGTLPAPADGA